MVDKRLVAAKSAQNLVCARLTRSHKGFVQDPYRRSDRLNEAIGKSLSEKSRVHAINYSLVMDLLGYSQSRLEKLGDQIDQLVFADALVKRSVIRELLKVADEQIEVSLARVKAAIADCDLDDINVITARDESYPALLKGIRRHPLVLFYRGYWELT